MKILCLGDVVARPGRRVVSSLLSKLRDEFSAHFVIVNGENSAGGSGIDNKCYRELRDAGADLITLGDHVWRRPEVKELLRKEKNRCISPANFPDGAPSRGSITIKVEGIKIWVANLLGRTFIQKSLDCPFQKGRELLESLDDDIQVKIVDFHGEATSEKLSFARRFDGELSLIFGTHTHVATADEQILPGGTAYITDIGMCGAHAGVIGMDEKTAVNRFITGMPSTYKAAVGDERVNGIVVEVDTSTGKAQSIERIQRAL